jgi:uncharacterized small protein (DUF1192 family)
MFDDDTPLKNKSTGIIPGEDLSEFSIEELKERRDSIDGEIKRIDAMIDSKQSGREVAESIFRQG